MDRDNARDTRAPSNRDVRLRRRTGLGGALVTGRALRRRSLNALSTRARHVHRHRQSSFAPSSPPFHHPSPPLARIRGAGRDRAIDPSSTPPVDVTPRASTPRTPRDFKKKFISPHPSFRVVIPTRASSLARAIAVHHHHHRAPPRARAHSIRPAARSFSRASDAPASDRHRCSRWSTRRERRAKRRTSLSSSWSCRRRRKSW